MVSEKFASQFTIVMINAKFVMAQLQMIVLLAMIHLFWMAVPAFATITITWILQIQHIVTKVLASNALIIIEPIKDYP